MPPDTRTEGRTVGAPGAATSRPAVRPGDVGVGILAGLLAFALALLAALAAFALVAPPVHDYAAFAAVVLATVAIGTALGARYRGRVPPVALAAGVTVALLVAVRWALFAVAGTVVTYPLLWGWPGVLASLAGPVLGGAAGSRLAARRAAR